MRKILKTRPNPNNRKDYTVTFEREIQFQDKPALRCHVSFRPDKLLLDHASFASYLTQWQTAEVQEPEEMALTILEDVTDQVVPKWIEVVLKTQTELAVTVTVKDQQPG